MKPSQQVLRAQLSIHEHENTMCVTKSARRAVAAEFSFFWLVL